MQDPYVVVLFRAPRSHCLGVPRNSCFSKLGALFGKCPYYLKSISEARKFPPPHKE